MAEEGKSRLGKGTYLGLIKMQKELLKCGNLQELKASLGNATGVKVGEW